jgi:uncharacterized membrane protein
VSWAAHLGWLSLQGAPFSYSTTLLGLVLVSILAVGEYFADQWPRTPSRVSPGPLIGRAVFGGYSGAALSVAAGQRPHFGILLGVGGALIGAVTGYQVRGWLVLEKKVKDLLVGLAEDVFCIGLAWWIVSPA